MVHSYDNNTDDSSATKLGEETQDQVKQLNSYDDEKSGDLLSTNNQPCLPVTSKQKVRRNSIDLASASSYSNHPQGGKQEDISSSLCIKSSTLCSISPASQTLNTLTIAADGGNLRYETAQDSSSIRNAGTNDGNKGKNELNLATSDECNETSTNNQPCLPVPSKQKVRQNSIDSTPASSYSNHPQGVKQEDISSPLCTKLSTLISVSPVLQTVDALTIVADGDNLRYDKAQDSSSMRDTNSDDENGRVETQENDEVEVKVEERNVSNVIESDEYNKEKIHNEISSYSRAPRQLNTKKSKIMSRQQNDEKKTHFKDMRDSIQRIKSEEEKIIDGMNIGSKMGLPEGLKVTKSIKGLYDIIRPVGNQWKLTKKHKIDVLDVTSELDIPEGWKVTKSIKGYGIIRPNGSQFDGGLGALAEYLGTKISYNGFEYSEKYKKRKLIKEKIDVLDVTSELDIPEGWKVTKSIKGYGILRPNGIQFDGGLGALAEYLGIKISYNGFEYSEKNKKRKLHNRHIAPENEPDTMIDVPIEVDIKKDIKKCKKRRKDSSNDQEEMSKKQLKQKNKKRKTIKRIVLKNLNQFSISDPITSVNVATPPVTTPSKPVENLGFKLVNSSDDMISCIQKNNYG